jgi:hypothetical protein
VQENLAELHRSRFCEEAAECFDKKFYRLEGYKVTCRPKTKVFGYDVDIAIKIDASKTVQEKMKENVQSLAAAEPEELKELLEMHGLTEVPEPFASKWIVIEIDGPSRTDPEPKRFFDMRDQELTVRHGCKVIRWNMATLEGDSLEWLRKVMLYEPPEGEYKPSYTEAFHLEMRQIVEQTVGFVNVETKVVDMDDL